MEQLVRMFQETATLLVAVVRAAVRSVRDNSGLAALSVVLAFGLWIFVTDSENPTSTRIVPTDISVQPINLPADVAVADDIPPVRVRVKVAEDVFEGLTAADFEATVDLDGLTVGEYQLPVEVRPLTSRGGLRIDDILPERIDVRLAQLTSKSIPVVIDVRGQPPSGYSMSLPEAEDETVFVNGPQERVDQVTQALAGIDVDGRTETVDQALRLSARDSRGILVTGVTIEPSLTEVRIDIEQEQFSRSMAVSPQITGAPKDGYNVVGVSVSPPAVTVRGEAAFIEGTISIPTKPLSIDGAEADVVQTVSLDLPSGAIVSGGVPTVTVTVKIEPAQGILAFTVPVSATGLADDLIITGALPPVTVNLFGELPALRKLTAADVSATVDLTGKTEGVQRIPVRATAAQGASVQSVNPIDIEVTVAKR